jgi:hypothetical protein
MTVHSRVAIALIFLSGCLPAEAQNKTCDAISAAVDRAQRRAAYADAEMFADPAAAHKAQYQATIANQLATIQANFVLAGLHKCSAPVEAVEVPRPYKRSSIACAVEMRQKWSRPQDVGDVCLTSKWEKDDESVK